jgi:LPS export ABC transporter protein LptC/lipopolysaccharide transport protein LptA
MRKILIITLFWISFASCLWAKEAENQQVEGFNLQGYDNEGEKSWDIVGDSANINGSEITLSNVNANAYGDQQMNVKAERGSINQADGKMRLEKDVIIKNDRGTKLVTDSLDWNRTEDLVSTEDKVVITDEGLLATGRGMSAKPGLKNAQINENVTVRMRTDPKEKESSSVTVTSDGPMMIDQLNNVASFEKNVSAIQGDRNLKADRMEIYFDIDKNKIKELVCIGNVEIIQGENRTYADRAVYRAEDKKVVLSGRPKMIMLTEGEDFAAFGN